MFDNKKQNKCRFTHDTFKNRNYNITSFMQIIAKLDQTQSRVDRGTILAFSWRKWLKNKKKMYHYNWQYTTN